MCLCPELCQSLRGRCEIFAVTRKKRLIWWSDVRTWEADKSVVDYVSEALLHILRNAVDHGIESPEERLAAGKDRRGKIIFSADNVAGELRMTISDDGKGIDEERVRERARQRGCLPARTMSTIPGKSGSLSFLPAFPPMKQLPNIPAGAWVWMW